MDVRKVILLISAIALAALSAFLAKSMFGTPDAPPAQAQVAKPAVPAGPEVIVAVKPLPIGTIIGPDSFRYQMWPAELVGNSYYVKGSADIGKLNGTVVRNAISAGQPITQGALVKPGDRGFLAAALGPGMRAVTVSTSAQAGVGGFVFPGDRVDLVLTQDVAGGGDGPALKAAETIIRNLRVLATDQRTNSEVDENGNTKVNQFSNVTLEATPRIAEKIALAQTMGQITLSLRSIADNAGELEDAIASGEVNIPNDLKAERKMLISVASRPSDSNTTFIVGADVSRFQRRSVPAKTASNSAPDPNAVANAAPAKPTGPIIRVVRGGEVTEVALGGK